MSRTENLRFILLRDVDRLAAEVGAYPSDAALWIEHDGVHNPGGTLALHLAGNLQHFVGAQMGASGYVRDRPREFAARGLSRTALLDEITAARQAIDAALSAMSDADLDATWTGGGPLGEDATVGLMLLHLSGHLMYHLGQVNYHRRLLAG